WRTPRFRRELPRCLATGRVLRGPYLQGCQTLGASDGAASQVRHGGQSTDGPGAQALDPAEGFAASGHGDRVIVRIRLAVTLFGTLALCLLLAPLSADADRPLRIRAGLGGDLPVELVDPRSQPGEQLEAVIAPAGRVCGKDHGPQLGEP